MSTDKIVIKGAREHNLKNVDVTIPRDKLIVMTGLSGSGKSSLAFGTIYADGQRRYMESLSSYARQFLGQMEKPDVDEIQGLSPAISIDQKTTSRNPRSTVGTVTEIYDYLRLMYARIGIPHCPVCGRVISQQTVDQMVDEVLRLPEGTRFQVLAPVVRGRKGTQQKEFEAARRSGFARVRVDGNMYELSEDIVLHLDSAASKKNIQLQLEGASVSVEGVRQVLYEMLYNIADNAVRYTNKDGIVKIFVGQRGSHPYYRVEDNGIGIPKEEQKRIFERFYRVDKSHSRETGGTGLGLSIVKHGAILHNAEIVLDSEPGQGTKMELVF